MFDCLTAYDGALLFCAFGLSTAIAYTDARTRQIPVHLLLILAGIGVVWCIKQAYIPVSLIPIGLSMAGLALVNRYWKCVIGGGDMLLFLVFGLYIPITILSQFLILCGVFGSISCAILQKRGGPFAPAMVLAAFISLISYMK